MKKIISSAAVAALVVGLAGCAPSQLSSFISGSGNHAHAPAVVIPGRVMTVSPVNHVSVGLFAPKVAGEDVIVRPFTPPRNLISVVQPIPRSIGILKSDEIVGVITRDGQTRVIPLPNFAPQNSSRPIVIHWPKQK